MGKKISTLLKDWSKKQYLFSSTSSTKIEITYELVLCKSEGSPPKWPRIYDKDVLKKLGMSKKTLHKWKALTLVALVKTTSHYKRNSMSMILSP